MLAILRSSFSQRCCRGIASERLPLLAGWLAAASTFRAIFASFGGIHSRSENMAGPQDSAEAAGQDREIKIDPDVKRLSDAMIGASVVSLPSRLDENRGKLPMIKF